MLVFGLFMVVTVTVLLLKNVCLFALLGDVFDVYRLLRGKLRVAAMLNKDCWYVRGVMGASIFWVSGLNWRFSCSSYSVFCGLLVNIGVDEWCGYEYFHCESA